MGTSIATKTKNNKDRTSDGGDIVSNRGKELSLRHRPVDIPQNIELFTDRLGKPYVLFPSARGRRVFPLDHDIVRAAVTNHLYVVRGRIPPSEADIKNLHRVLEAQAVLKGIHEVDDDWASYLLDQTPLAQAVYYLVTVKCPTAPADWVTNASSFLNALDMTAAKEGIEKTRDWPTDASRVIAALEGVRETLRELGVVFVKEPRNKKERPIRFTHIGESGRRSGSSPGLSPVPSPGSSPALSPTQTHFKPISGKEYDGEDALVEHLSEVAITTPLVRRLTKREVVAEFAPRVVGNHQLLESVRAFVDQFPRAVVAERLLVTGPDGSGKSLVVRTSVREMLCEATDKGTRGWCGACHHCVHQMEYEQGTDEFEFLRTNQAFYYGRWVCDALTPDKVGFEMSKLKAHKGRVLLYLDRLDQTRASIWDELKPVLDDNRVWCLATARDVGRIPGDVLRAFEHAETTAGSFEERAEYLAELCGSWGIAAEGHALVTLTRLTAHIGEAVRVLADATENAGGLTASFVEGYRW